MIGDIVKSLEHNIAAQSVKNPPGLPHRSADPPPIPGQAESVEDILQNLRAKLVAPGTASPARVLDAGVQTELTRTQDAAVGPDGKGTGSVNHCPVTARPVRAQLGYGIRGAASERANRSGRPHVFMRPDEMGRGVFRPKLMASVGG